jgi:HEPN domain-containing protein
MINPNAYECIYISKANFDSVELLLLSNNFFTFFSAGFLCHLSFELLLKGLITLEKKEYPSIHTLKKLIKTLSEEKQKNLEKIITVQTLYGEHCLYSTVSNLRDEILKLKIVTDETVSSVVVDHLQLLHGYRYYPNEIGSEDFHFYKAIYNALYLSIQEEYKEVLTPEEIPTKRMKQISVMTEKVSAMTEEEREVLRNNAIKQDIEKWQEVQRLYETRN